MQSEKAFTNRVSNTVATTKPAQFLGPAQFGGGSAHFEIMLENISG